MALTSNDETDLLLPLLGPQSREAPFAQFLTRLQRRTRAERVVLHIRAVAGETSARTAWLVSTLGTRDGRVAGRTLIESHGTSFRPGRVYAPFEFTDHDPRYAAERSALLASAGLADERAVRCGDAHTEAATLVVFLAMARSVPCSAADSALLSELVPYVAAAFQTFVAKIDIENQRNVSADVLARAGFAVTPTSTASLALPEGHQTGVAANGPDVMVLGSEPRVETRVLAQTRTIVPGIDAVEQFTVARSASHPASRPLRVERLAVLRDLPRREAELAVHLADGLSISEAAQAMAISVETARSYSKNLYAKLGVRGQGDLVRIVCGSIAMLA